LSRNIGAESACPARLQSWARPVIRAFQIEQITRAGQSTACDGHKNPGNSPQCR